MWGIFQQNYGRFDLSIVINYYDVINDAGEFQESIKNGFFFFPLLEEKRSIIIIIRDRVERVWKKRLYGKGRCWGIQRKENVEMVFQKFEALRKLKTPLELS